MLSFNSSVEERGMIRKAADAAQAAQRPGLAHPVITEQPVGGAERACLR